MPAGKLQKNSSIKICIICDSKDTDCDNDLLKQVKHYINSIVFVVPKLEKVWDIDLKKILQN